MDEGGGDEGDGGDPASPLGLQIASSAGFFVSLSLVDDLFLSILEKLTWDKRNIAAFHSSGAGEGGR